MLLPAAPNPLPTKAYLQSIMTGNAVWATPEIDIAVEDRKAPGHMCEDKVEDILNAKRTRGKNSETDNAPFDVERHAACIWSRVEAEKTLDSTFMSIMTGKEYPNAEQHFFLEHFIRRLKLEMLEER